MTEADVTEIRRYFSSLKTNQNGGTSIQLIADLWGLKKDDIKPLVADLIGKKGRRSTGAVKKHAKKYAELTTARAKVPDLVRQGLSDAKIAKEVGCSQAWVSEQRRNAGMKPNYESSSWRRAEAKRAAEAAKETQNETD